MSVINNVIRKCVLCPNPLNYVLHLKGKNGNVLFLYVSSSLLLGVFDKRDLSLEEFTFVFPLDSLPQLRTDKNPLSTAEATKKTMMIYFKSVTFSKR